MTYPTRTMLAISILAFSAAASPAAEPDILILSVSSDAEVDGLRVNDRQAVGLRLDRSLWYLSTDLGELLPSGVDVDALSVMADGAIVVSTDVSFRSGGLEMADEDLLLVRDGEVSVVFDASTRGLPEAADIDAVHVVELDPLEIYYSVAAPAVIGGRLFQDDDIIHWRGGTHSLAVSGADLFGSQRDRLDVDGLWVDEDDGDLLVSTDVGFINLDSVASARDDDILHYRLSTGRLSLFAELSDHGLDSARVDVDALGDAGPHVFADGFESGDTTRWSVSVP